MLHKRMIPFTPAAYTLLILIFSILFISCSGKPPEIIRIDWQVNIEKDLDKDVVFEALSLFVEASDPDGIDDIEYLYVINDSQELYWELSEENWIKEKRGNETWIGSNHIVMPDGGYFPPGTYRILLRDAGGDSDEREIRITGAGSGKLTGSGMPGGSRAFSGIYFQKAMIHGNKILIDRLFPGTELWIYDSNGKYVSSYRVKEKSTEIRNLTRIKPVLSRGFTYKLYRYNGKIKRGIITGPFYYSPAPKAEPVN